MIRQISDDVSIPIHLRNLLKNFHKKLYSLTVEREIVKRALGGNYQRALKSFGMIFYLPILQLNLVDKEILFLLNLLVMEEEGSNFNDAMLTITAVGIGLFLVLYILRQWIKGPQFTEKISARGKVAIITGANSGLFFTLKMLFSYIRFYHINNYLAI